MNAKEKHEVFWACFFRSFYDEEDVDIRLEHVGLDLDDTYGTSMRITWAVGLLAAGALPCLQQSNHHCVLCNVWLLGTQCVVHPLHLHPSMLGLPKL